MKVFTVYRTDCPEGAHTSEAENAPDEVQFEGVVFDDGSCAIRWMTEAQSTVLWDSFATMWKVHGHPEYGTVIVWHQVIERELKVKAAPQVTFDMKASGDAFVRDLAKACERMSRLKKSKGY